MKGINRLLICLLVGLSFAGCGPSRSDLEVTATQVAAGVFATQTAAVPTRTPTRTATPTLAPTSTPAPTSPPTVTPTPSHTSTPVVSPTPCLPDAALVADVSVPDGTQFASGEEFTKVWRVRSSGCEPWPDGTVWAFVSGDRMAAPSSVPVAEMGLGETVDVAVEMKAPDAPGTYKGFWQMQAPDGARFGDRVYVVIEVPAPEASPSDSPGTGEPLPPPPPEATAPSAPDTGSGNVRIVNETGDRIEVAFSGPPHFFFVLGNYDNVVEVAPGDYVYNFKSCGHLWAGGDREQMERITIKPGIAYEIHCYCQPVHQIDKPSRIIDMRLWCSISPWP